MQMSMLEIVNEQRLRDLKEQKIFTNYTFKKVQNINYLFTGILFTSLIFNSSLDLNFDLENDDNRTVYLPLQKKVFEQMKFGVFPEFLQSIHFQRCLLCLPHPVEFPSNEAWKLPSNNFIPEFCSPFIFAKSLAQLNGVEDVFDLDTPDLRRSDSIGTLKSSDVTNLNSTFPICSEPTSPCPVEEPSPCTFSPLSAVDSVGPLSSTSMSLSIEETKTLNTNTKIFNSKSALSPAAKEWKSRFVKTTLFSNDVVVGASFISPPITSPINNLSVKIQPYPKVEEMDEEDEIFSSKFLSSSHGNGMSPRDKFLS